MEYSKLRYILCKDSSNSKEDIIGRKNYIYDTFPEIFRIEVIDYEDRIELECYSLSKINIVVLIGHNTSVSKFIYANSNSIVCDTLIIISCYMKDMNLHKLKKVKRIFASKTTKDETQRIKGQDFGFNFNITDSELMLYNLKKLSLNNRLKLAFDYLDKQKRKAKYGKN